MNIPKDPVILLSYMNTQLRDTKKSLDELCEYLDCNREDICLTLNHIDYHYDKTQNQFV